MIKTQVICDFCERPLTPIDNIYLIEKPIEYDTRDMFPHMCINCAKKLDRVLVAYRKDIMYRSELGSKFARINKERKQRLGTKG